MHRRSARALRAAVPPRKPRLDPTRSTRVACVIGRGNPSNVAVVFATIPMLTTDRLLLRAWRDSDLEPFATLNADPEVTEFLRGPMTRAESDAWVERINASWAANGYGVWAVEVVGGPDFIGCVGLAEARIEVPFTPAIEVLWRLTPSAWGHGFATEGARAALSYGFRDAGLPEI